LSYALDSNILLRSIEENHPQQNEALDVINKLIGRGEEIFLLPQSLYEFWVVATRPKKDNGLELSAVEADAVIAKFVSVFPIKYDNPAVFQQWRQLVTQHSVLGKNSHDARLAAAASAQGITRFVTFNKDHFKRFSDITALLPSEV
jgi:predicted nucleic acid-binding protein